MAQLTRIGCFLFSVTLSVALSIQPNETDLQPANSREQLSARVAPPPGLNPGTSLLNSVVNNGIRTGLGVPYVYHTVSVGEPTQLYIPPGSQGSITVVVKNDGGNSDFEAQVGGSYYGLNVYLDQTRFYIPASGSVNIMLKVVTLQTTPLGSTSILTLIVRKSSDFTTATRQISIFARAEPNDGWKPTCRVLSVTRCESYTQTNCYQKTWRLTMDVRDRETGLRTIALNPETRFIGEDFLVGTNESVTIEHEAVCCSPVLEVIATDLRGNKETCRVDQNNLDNIVLGSGDIAAIVLGVILLILLIAIVIALVCRCCHRKKKVKVTQRQ